MTWRLVRAELLKLRGTPSSWWLVGLALAAVSVGVVLTLALTQVRPGNDVRSLLSFAGTGGLVAILAGVVSTAGEHRHRTIVATALATPRRSRAYFAQVASLAIWGLLLGVAAATLTTAIALPWLAAKGVTPNVPAARLMAIYLGAVAYTGGSAALGAGVGALARNQVAAATAVFAYLAILDPTLATLVPAYGQFSLTALGTALSGGVSGGDGPTAQLLPLWAAAVVYGLCTGVVVVAGLATTLRRDL